MNWCIVNEPILGNCFWPYKMLVCRGNLTTFVFIIKLAACLEILSMQSQVSRTVPLSVVIYLCLTLKTSNVFMELMLFDSEF